jgi:hypothetical protein
MTLPWIIGAAVAAVAAVAAGVAAATKKNCDECGDAYWSSDYGSYYCSEECREEAKARRKRKKIEKEAKRKERKRKKVYKIQEIIDYKNNRKAYFKNQYDAYISFDIDTLNIEREPSFIKKAKSLESQVKELDEVIAILERKKSAIG